MGSLEKKLLKIIKKNAGLELEASDIAVMARCDEDDVTLALDALEAENLVSKKANAKGNMCWYPAEETVRMKPKRINDLDLDDPDELTTEKTTDVLEKTELFERSIHTEETRAAPRAAPAAAAEDVTLEIGDAPANDDFDESVVRQNPITSFFMNLVSRSPKMEDEANDGPALPDEPLAKIRLGKVEKKILAVLKKDAADDLDAEDIAMRLKRDEDEVAEALEQLRAKSLVSKKMTDKNRTIWSAV